MRESIAQELFAKANQAILEAQWLRERGRSLRVEAASSATSLGETILRGRVKSKSSEEPEA